VKTVERTAPKPLEAPAEGVAAKAKLGDEGKKHVAPGATVASCLDAMAAAGAWLDAIRLMARALPRREAVWWACVCVRRVLNEKDPPEEAAALDAAIRWVSTQTEDARRAAFAAAEVINFESPAAIAALAAFWSGGSLSLPKLPPVPPPEHLLPTAAGNAAILAGVKGEPEKAAEKYAALLALGRDVAEGTNRWPEEKPKPAVKR
jgi:hypothetical protein